MLLKIIPTFLFSGIFSIFHLHRPDQRHDLLPIYPCPLVVLRSKHLCLGAVCVAHGYNQLLSNDFFLLNPFSSSEKGICLPTVFLWLLFVYIEAAIRLKVIHP